MKVTDEMMDIFSRHSGGASSSLQAVLDHLKAEGLLVEPFDPEAWDGETEPPVGYRVVDHDADVWSHGDAGWGTRSDGSSGFYRSDPWSQVRQYGPFALVPGGPVSRDDW